MLTAPSVRCRIVTGFTLTRASIMKPLLYILACVFSLSLTFYGFYSGHAFLTVSLIVAVFVAVLFISFAMWLEDEHERDGQDPFKNPYNQPED